MAFNATREIPATPDQIFQAFEDVNRLATWWGPKGFTNTFTRFEFQPGGQWVYTMHGPDGRDYPNEILVTSISRPHQITFHHVSLPRYDLTVNLIPVSDTDTKIEWNQEFEKPSVAKAISHIVTPGIEELLDRLTANVARAVPPE